MFSLCTLIPGMTDVEFKRRLTNQLIFTYAREILRLCMKFMTGVLMASPHINPAQPQVVDRGDPHFGGCLAIRGKPDRRPYWVNVFRECHASCT